jgi:rSAM/selenodomain-associated transferase 1
VSALVVAKAPAARRTKTRLGATLGVGVAQELGRAMLLDTLDGCRAEVPNTGVLFSQPRERAVLAELVGPATRLVLQAGAGLGDALRSGAAEALGRSDAVALVASDVPGVPPGALTAAFEALDGGADVVFGPGLDGGYWLVALSRPWDAPFAGVPWSSPSTLASTLDRCAEHGLVTALVEPWRDVDTTEDLVALVPLLDELPGRRTAALVARLASAGVLPDTTQPEEVPLS